MKEAPLTEPRFIQGIIVYPGETWLVEALSKLDVINMPPIEQALLDIAIVNNRMARAQREDELKEVALESKKEGVEISRKSGVRIGMELGMEVTLLILQLYKLKMPEEEIAKELDLPPKEIKEVIAKFNKIGWKE